MTNSVLGYLTTAVNALLGLAVLFGLNLTEEQIAGILTAISAVAALAFAVNTAKGKPAEIRAAAKAAGVDV